MADLKVNFSLLESIERSLSSLHSEFQNIQVNTSAYDGAMGSGDVASAMDGFAGNWSDHRKNLISSMQSLGKMVSETIQSAYAKIIALSDRFTTPISDMSQYASVAKSLAGIAGISAATSGVAGISATVLNGRELDAGDWRGTAYIPPLHNWFYTHLEVPMGAPAGG